MIDLNELRKVACDCYWPTSPVPISKILDRLKAAESDGLEQARLNGMGGEREAALLSKLEAAEKERDALRAELNELRYGVAVAHDTIKALRAKIEEMERQEPAWFIDERGEPKRYHKSKADYCKYGGLDLLYALPGAKGE